MSTTLENLWHSNSFFLLMLLLLLFCIYVSLLVRFYLFFIISLLLSHSYFIRNSGFCTYLPIIHCLNTMKYFLLYIYTQIVVHHIPLLLLVCIFCKLLLLSSLYSCYFRYFYNFPFMMIRHTSQPMSLRGSFAFFIVHSKCRKFLSLGGFPLSHAAMKYPEVKAVVGHVFGYFYFSRLSCFITKINWLSN